MADQQDSSSDNVMDIVCGPPPTTDGALAWRDGSGQIQGSYAIDTIDNRKNVQNKEENAIARGEYSHRENKALANLRAEGVPDTEKWLINPAFMKVVEAELSKANATTTSQRFKDEPWFEPRQQHPLQMQQTLPLYHQPTSRVPTETFLSAGPSWDGASHPDMMWYCRSGGRYIGPGILERHHPSGDASTSNELARLTRRRGHHHGNSTEHQRSSHPYDPRHRDTTGTAVLRNSRFVRQPRGNEFESRPPPLTYPVPYNIQQYPPPEEQFQILRNILNIGRTPDHSPQTFTPRLASQYSRSPQMVYIPSSPPNRSASPRMAELFDVPIARDEPEQPLDLSVLPRDPSTFIPISQSSSSYHAEARAPVCATPRSCPVTSTVTSTDKFPVNTEVFNPFDLLPRLPLITEESYQSTNQTEKEQNRIHRAKTPTDILPEHLIYKTWPVDNWPHADHIEEVETSDCDTWLDYLRTLESTPADTSNPPPPVRSTSPPKTKTSPSPPCTTSC